MTLELNNQVKSTIKTFNDSENKKKSITHQHQINNLIFYMFCTHCGKQILNQASFCQSCGKSVGGTTAPSFG
ncbi:hypothetical protein COZ39_00480 [Candidatus Roizmanbacteria bacterium CG_4_10_14_3_um_filter_33_21]|uniref:Zinc-ribbon domain-containing protein n=2 Tax=Candidatus Roizmaniibacteriota TaxID=1752723 RepID=A0A2M7M127_9BACT|nr:MAG: hypothetical protein COZ39_00480 [Candidatus Roizmanbacteria bacterium CG_4_10_14_3_um_filter_33_21]